MKKWILILVSVCSSMATHAQVTPVDSSTNKVIIIPEEKSSQERNSTGQLKTSTIRNAIRWNMLELGRGIIAFGYERGLSNWLSLDFVLGYTIKDYFDLALQNIDGNTNSSGYVDRVETTSDGGLAFMTGIRLYPVAYGNLEGFYIAPHYYTKDYNSTQTISAQVKNTAGDWYYYHNS